MQKLTIGLVARICHETNRAYCESIGDHSQQPWNMAAHWQRESAINGVINYLNNKEIITPRDLHNNWMQDKLNRGWQYGEVKDELNKTHPCLVPYDSLPEEHKVKDTLFLAICVTLAQYIED